MRPFAFVVDDNRLIANSLVQMLNLIGYEAEAAYGSMMALQVLAQKVPDVILLDIHMQGLNGVELCRHIRRDPRLAKVPVLAISTDTQEAMLNGMRDAGANGFLAKPIEFDDLERVLGQITGTAASTGTLGDRRDAPPHPRPQ